MYTEGFEQWFKMNKNITSPFNEWNKTCTELCRRVTQQSLEIFGENVSRLSDRLKRFSNVRKPEDFFNLQKESFQEDIAATIENTQKLVHSSMENMEEFTKLWGSMCSTVHETATTMTNKTSEKQEKSGR